MSETNNVVKRICKNCNSQISVDILEANYDICPVCGSYMRIHAKRRIKYLADDNRFDEWDKISFSYNPLNDVFYEQVLIKNQQRHNLQEAVVTGEIQIAGISVAIGVMDTRFMMASMGHVVGEKITRLFENASKRCLPVILFCCSGGARMQEGIISLMQMEKTAAAVKRHSNKGLLYISILTNPTMGGVTASFAMLADIILAEKNATIGFAGKRVIEQNTGEKLPENFQSAEFQVNHGFVDRVVDRKNLKDEIIYLLRTHTPQKRIIFKKSTDFSLNNNTEHKATLSAWERVQLARKINRPTSRNYISKLFDSFYELKGDRAVGDDHAIIGGIATFHGIPFTVIGTQKGKKSINEALFYNWGMASPSGYRKALRLAKEAEKFGRPVLFLIDTIGASCGKNAEEQGQGAIIGNLLQELSVLKVPILSIVIGEGGSGGALALGVGNEVWMLENAVYSILSPEGYASILWRDNSKAKDAAEIMKLEAKDLFKLGVVDRIIYESEPVTTENMSEVCEQIEYGIFMFLNKYSRVNVVKQRYKRFRKY